MNDRFAKEGLQHLALRPTALGLHMSIAEITQKVTQKMMENKKIMDRCLRKMQEQQDRIMTPIKRIR